MINRKAIAIWKGTGKEGTGILTTQSTVLENTPYSFNTRFDQENGTNPEELIAAAHAGCFAMKLSFELNAAGYTAQQLQATASVTLDPFLGKIIQSHLHLRAWVREISQQQFTDIAQKAKTECPVSQLLHAEIVLTAELVEVEAAVS